MMSPCCSAVSRVAPLWRTVPPRLASMFRRMPPPPPRCRSRGTPRSRGMPPTRRVLRTAVPRGRSRGTARMPGSETGNSGRDERTGRAGSWSWNQETA
jgi:hypothetical protein